MLGNPVALRAMDRSGDGDMAARTGQIGLKERSARSRYLAKCLHEGIKSLAKVALDSEISAERNAQPPQLLIHELKIAGKERLAVSEASLKQQLIFEWRSSDNLSDQDRSSVDKSGIHRSCCVGYCP